MARKNYYLFIFFVIACLVFVFYGRIFRTWFQQDEWDWIGRYFYYNSISKIPFLESFKSSFFPHPRYRFAPLFDMFYAMEVFFFKLNFSWYAFISLVLHILNSFLVFLVVLRFTKNKNLSSLSGILFAISGIGQKAIIWTATTINTQGAAFFSFLAIFFYFNYLDKGKSANLFKVLFFLSVALWFKETAISLLFLLPATTVITKGVKPLKKLLPILAIYVVVYFLIRIFLGKIGAQIHTEGYPDFGRFLTLPEYINVLVWTPLRSLVDVFIFPTTLISLGKVITPILWSSYRGLENTTKFGLFAETTGVDAVTFILIFPLLLIFYFVYKHLAKGNRLFLKPFLLGIAFLFTSSFIAPLLAIRGQSAFVHVLRSRDLYISIAGSSILISLTAFSLFKKKNFLIKVIAVFILFIYSIYNWQYLQKVIFADEITKAELRKPIIEDIYKTYPVLPKKTIFYTESDTPYYGSSTPSLPYQTGFGRTLLVWHLLKGASLPPEFAKADFLFYAGEQGYKEIGEYGFGYFTELEKLKKAINENNLKPVNVFAFSYFGKTKELVDITKSIRTDLEKGKSNEKVLNR